MPSPLKIINAFGSKFWLLCFYIYHSMCLCLIDAMHFAQLGFVLFLCCELVFSLRMYLLCLRTSKEMSFRV